jgi:hypothetical protein
VVPLEENTSWFDLVNDQIHSETRVGSRFGEETWDLYDRCGYFTLSGKSPADFAPLRQAFLSTSRQLDHAPHLGCHVVSAASTGGVRAALSVLKVYRGTWLGYQMAKTSGDIDGIPGRAILRDIHLRAYEHVQRDPQVAWVLGYVQVKRVWSKLAHYDMPLRHVASGDAAIVRFRALEVPCTAHREETNAPEVQVGTASRTEALKIAGAIRRLRPWQYADALDLVPERIQMEEIRRSWNRSRFERERGLLVARVHGVAVAAAIVEIGAEGMHLFNLLDLARLYPLTAAGVAHFPRLLEAAKAWFLERGRSKYVLFQEEDMVLPDEVVAGFGDMGQADMTILAAARVPELLEHVFEITAPRAR